jgi:sulfate permease, SulP family
LSDTRTRLLPAADWLAAYQRPWLKADVVAGLTTAAVVIPKAMAYATVAGLPIQVGLYTSFVALVVYALLGTSRPLSVTTTTTIAILVGAELGEVAPDADAATLVHATALLSLMVGAVLVLGSVLRLGFVANFISEPVLVGFKAGIGVVIVVDQLGKVLGVHYEKGTFVHNLVATVLSVPHASIPTVIVGTLAIASLAALEHYRPRWPAPLIVVAIAIVAVVTMGLRARGIELVGAIPQGLPALTMPDLSLAGRMWPGALGIALMSFTETTAAARAFATRDEPTPRPNVELFATGVANAAGAFLGAMPSGGGTSQTAVNRLTGAHTQLSGLVTAATTLLGMLLLAPVIALMPQAVLAGIVIVYSIGLVQPRDFRDILAVRRTEFFWAVAAFLGVMLLGTLQGILVAIVISMVALAHQTANPPVYVLGRKRGTNVFRPNVPEHADDETFEGLLLLKLEGRLFFLNAERIAEKVRHAVAAANPKVVVFDLSAVFDLEYSALRMLTDAEQSEGEHGVAMWLAALTPEVLDVVERSPLGRKLGRERMLFNLEAAVARFEARRAENEV